MFNNARNFTVNNGQFTHVEINRDDAVSTTLLQHVAAGAMFDSAERYPPGKCHPGTQEAIMLRINNWILNQKKGPHSALWLYGSAGCGKSAIMQSICERLKKLHPESYAGSFFFARGHANRGKGVKLFTTLSYQLAIHFPSLRKEINDALYDDSALPTKSMDIQLRSLIIDPLLRCKDFPEDRPVLFIDGLDECDDDQGIDTQREIITLIAKSLAEHEVPVRFMIASRPEYWIRDEFEASPLTNSTLRLALQRDLFVDRDIALYLRREFDQIRTQNSRLMRSVNPPWPPANIIDRFVEEASGQYIYASTVLKFVGKTSRFSNPQKQLQIITTPGPHRASAFTDLDRLYATILSVYPDIATIKCVLAGLLVTHSSTVIQIALGVDPEDVILVLDALRSLINIVPPGLLSKEEQEILFPIFGSGFAGEDKVTFCHLSFREFLQDETRSGLYHIDSTTPIRAEITGAFFGIIQRNIDQRYDKEPHVSLNIGLSSYHRMMSTIIEHITRHRDITVLLPLMNDMTAKLQALDSSIRIKYPPCFMQDMDWVSSLAKKCHEDFSKDQHKLGVTDQMLHSIADLQEIAALALRNGITQLSQSEGYEITPALVYMDLVWSKAYNQTIPLPELLSIPKTSEKPDVLSTLQKYRHLLYHLKDTGQKLYIDLGLYKDAGSTEGWLSSSKLINQRIMFVALCLKSVITKLDNRWEHSAISVPLSPTGEVMLTGTPKLDNRWGRPSVKFIDPKDIIFKQFFNDRGISDIKNKDYVESQYNLYLLSIMVDVEAWTSVLPSREYLWTCFSSFLCPILCWFNRQLTNRDTVRLIEDHDPSLPRRMALTMTAIFQICVLPIFTIPYFSELQESSPVPQPNAFFKPEPKSIRLKMSPLTYSIEKIPYKPPAKLDDLELWTFHRELFVTHGSADKPVVEPSLWYPYLGSYILNKLAKYFYRCVHASSSYTIDAYEAYGILYPFITKCLPFAQVSQQNLDAFRALKHLTPPRGFPWFPPSGFCSLTMDFLKKYDSSVLSSDELFAFEDWLDSIKHLEEKKGLTVGNLGDCRRHTYA